MDVTAEAIEIGNRDCALTVTTGLSERGGKLGAALDRVRAFAGLDLNELGDDFEAIGGGESSDGGPLGDFAK